MNQPEKTAVHKLYAQENKTDGDNCGILRLIEDTDIKCEVFNELTKNINDGEIPFYTLVEYFRMTVTAEKFDLSKKMLEKEIQHGNIEANMVLAIWYMSIGLVDKSSELFKSNMFDKNFTFSLKYHSEIKLALNEIIKNQAHVSVKMYEYAKNILQQIRNHTDQL